MLDANKSIKVDGLEKSIIDKCKQRIIAIGVIFFVSFITVNIKTRAKRSYLELKRLNKKINFKEVLKSVKKYDKIDYNREISPLTKKFSMLINGENLTKRACF